MSVTVVLASTHVIWSIQNQESYFCLGSNKSHAFFKSTFFDGFFKFFLIANFLSSKVGKYAIQS